ncbi:hypothetical protein NA56DRAFT_660954 [Hyaloscypha hepaticicola]|uniref:Uncharacterized protein n=1 Tax=Hyaloscypha hepaticicola TaxID=2082293 RepID=A0A2J6PYY6_9HELO|nr:hypothetical protein NA56DRAFT_660954 [Hyaloscypha hepaticicola]
MSPQNPTPLILPTPQDPLSTPSPPTPKRQRLHPSPSSNNISQKDSNLSHIENQRRELTKCIIENLGRDELEELLLETALGNEEVMRSVVRINSSSHVQVRSSSVNRGEDGSVREWRSGRGEGGGDQVLFGGGEEDGDGDGEGMGEKEGRSLGMDGLRGVDGGGGCPMQFHHVTRRQFEVRMVRIKEKGFEAEGVDWGTE